MEPEFRQWSRIENDTLVIYWYVQTGLGDNHNFAFRQRSGSDVIDALSNVAEGLDNAAVEALF